MAPKVAGAVLEANCFFVPSLNRKCWLQEFTRQESAASVPVIEKCVPDPQLFERAADVVAGTDRGGGSRLHRGQMEGNEVPTEYIA
jgi:hypothetical protein